MFYLKYIQTSARNEPPPPYSPNDPSSSIQPAVANQSSSTPAVIPATLGVNPTPVSVPTAPLPSTSTIPIAIPGPPAGQGPKMGRRKKPTTPQKTDPKKVKRLK
jgi:hypothetical protein